MPSPKAERPPLFLDTNIFVYAAGSPEGEEDPKLRALTAACKEIISALGEERLRGVTSLVVLQEIIYLFRRFSRERKDKSLALLGKKIVSEALALMEEVYVPTRWEFARALAAYKPEKHDFNDLLIVEALRAHGLKEIVTADRGFERFEGLQRLDPLKLAEGLQSRQ